MLSRLQEPDRSAGFTLGEVLVALAIAAMLAAMLTRFVASTRFNAAKVRELVDMETLSQSILERMSPRDVRLGRTDGRSAGFAWRVDVRPLEFTAQARRVNETPKPAAAASQSQRTRFKSMSSSNFHDETESRPVQTVDVVPYHVTLVIEARSGRRYAADTIRIAPAQTGAP